MNNNPQVSPIDGPDADLGEGGVFLPLTGRIVYPEDDRVLRFLREGWFEYRELTMMSRLVRPGDCFVDVGAHCGLYSKLAARRMKGVGTIIVVEPNPVLHPYLRKNLGDVVVVTDGAVKAGEINLVRGAVATASDTALLQVGDSGWTAYSTLNSASSPHLTQSIPVTTYTLESLIVEGQADQQIIVKLDTEGLEYDILDHAAPLLEKRNDIHLMIEFDENNLATGNRSTAALVELIESMGYILAKFDRQTERLVPFASPEPLWGANLVATKNLGLLNGRLGNLDDAAVVAETEDFLRRGEVAEQIYRNSEDLRKTLDSSMEMAMKIAGTTAALEGSSEIEAQVAAQLASVRERPDAELPSAVVDLLTDELARLAGTARGVANQLDSTRQAMHRAREEISQLDARLADQRRVVVSARAELQGDKGGVAEGHIPENTRETGEVAQALDLTGKMSDDIGRLIGAARWFAEEVSKGRRESEEARMAAQSQAEAARGEIDKLAAELSEKTQAVDSLSLLRDEAAAAARALEAARSDLAKLVSETSHMPEAKSREDALALQQKVKARLSEAAWRLAFGARQARGPGTRESADPGLDELRAETDRLRLENRELAADIHRIGALLANARQSQWLRLGSRVGADLADKLDKAASVLEEAGKRGQKAPAGEAS